MKLPTRLLLTAALALGFGLGHPLVAHAGSPANVAQAVNTKDGSSLFDFAFAIHKVAGDVVDDTNAAVAYASCNSCQTVAIALDIVIVTGTPRTFTPENVAIAYNENCNLCDTFASAYQIVVDAGRPVHFTPDGRKELEDIRKEIASWGKAGLTPAEMRERLPALIDRVKQILATQLVDRGKPGDEGDQSDEQTTDTNEGGPPAAPTSGSSTTGGVTTVPAPSDTTTEPADTTTTGTVATTTGDTTTATTPATTTTAP